MTHPRGAGRVVVYDPDGLNPYGRELGVLLAGSFDTLVLCPCDTAWLPEQVPCVRALPGNLGGRPRWRQALSLLRGVGAALLRARPGGAALVLVFTRSAVEEIAFALLARTTHKVLVLAHEPSPRTPLSPVRSWARRQLLAAGTVVAHSKELADQTAAVPPYPVVGVIEHLPFTAWAAAHGPWPSRDGGTTRLLMLGQLRADKGPAHVPRVLERLPDEVRHQLVLRICGRGRLAASVAGELGALVAVEDLSGDAFRSEEEVANSVRASHVLLAPYEHASQSGSIVLALSCDLPVIAFAAGAIGDLVSDGGLVPVGDHEAMAAAVQRYVATGAAGQSRQGLSDWRTSCMHQWASAVRALGTPARR